MLQSSKKAKNRPQVKRKSSILQSIAVWLALLVKTRAFMCPEDQPLIGVAQGTKETRIVSDTENGAFLWSYHWRPIDAYGTGIPALSLLGFKWVIHDGTQELGFEEYIVDASSGSYNTISKSNFPLTTYAWTVYSDGVSKLGVTDIGGTRMGATLDTDPKSQPYPYGTYEQIEVRINGPPVGFHAYVDNGLIQGVSFISNMCMCHDQIPIILDIPDQTVELTHEKSFFVPAYHKWYESYPNMYCEVTLETPDGADIVLYKFAGDARHFIMNPQTSDLVGTHTRTIVGKLHDYDGTVLHSMSTTVTITIFGCERQFIAPMVIDDMTVAQGQTVTQTLSPSVDTHNYTLECPLSLSTTDGSDLITFNGFEMSVYTDDPTMTGTFTRNVRVTMTGLGTTEFTPEFFDFYFQITVIPACQLSTLQQVGSIVSMSTPVYGNIYQDLEGLFTHEHAATWPLDSCVISYKILGGDTSFMRMIAGDEAKPNVLNRMHQYTSEFNDEGTYSVNIIAWYVEYTDATPPTQEVTISAPISVTVEPHCPITSFINNPAVSTLVDIDYVINTGATYLPFEIAFEPAACNFIKSYMITVDGGAIATPYWVTVDSNSNPARVVINSNQASDEGIYSISISSQLNTTPGISSSVPYVFVVSMSSDPCSWILFDSQTINMSFTIQDGASPTTTSFNEYTNDGGQSQCGARQYQIVSGHTGLILSTRTLSFTTTEPADVGVHTFVLMVQLQSYPQFNPVVRRFEDVTVTVTAVCVESALMQYTVPVELIHIQGRAVSTYQIPAIQDTISQAVGPDGLTYCGPRVYEHVALSSTEHTPVDSAVASFDTTDTYSIDGSLPEQWGHYQITFGVSLNFYPDFVRQDFSFTFQIVPDCEMSVFSQSLTLSDFDVYRGFQDSFDFAGVYSYDLQGAYSEYCGPLEYVLDPVAPPSQSYLTYDGATTLTVAPSMTETTGTFSHVLRVQLRDFASTYLDEPFEVQIRSCTVTGQFLESNNQVAVAPARQDFSQTIEYLIGKGQTVIYDLSFEDFDTVEDDGCQSIYTRTYSLWVDSVDVSLSPPDWASAFDPALPLLSIQTLDGQFGGLTHTIEVKAALTGVVNRDADTKVIVNLTFLTDPCLLVTLTPLTLSDMAYTIKYGAEIEQQWFEVVKDSVGACGEVQYDVSGDHPANLILLDPIDGVIEVWTQDGTHAWTDPTVRGATYTITVDVSLADYQALTAQIGVSATFTLTLDSVCFDTELYSESLGPFYYQQGNPVSTQVTMGVKDSASYYESDGYDLCGLRTYSVDELLYHSIDAEGTDVTFSVFDAFISTHEVGNRVSQVTVTAGLKDYPLVEPISVSIRSYIIKPCDKQIIFPVLLEKYDYFMTFVTIGQEAQTFATMPVMIELNAFFLIYGAPELAQQDICGPLEARVTQASYESYQSSGQFSPVGGDGIGVVPEWIELTLTTTSQGITYTDVSLQTDDPDAKQYESAYFIELAPKGSYGQLSPYWSKLVITVEVNDASAALLNNAPVFEAWATCENLLVPIYEDGEAGNVFQGLWLASDPDIEQPIFLYIDYPKSNTLLLECPTCLLIQQFTFSLVSQRGLFIQVVPRNMDWLWQSMDVAVVATDFISSTAKNYKVIYVPSSVANQGGCLSLEELIEIAGPDSPLSDLRPKEETEIIKPEPIIPDPEPIIPDPDDPDVIVDIEVVVEEAAFDVKNFFAEFAKLFLMGSIDVESSNYDFVMTQLRKLDYPLPLVVGCDQLGEVDIHFSRALIQLDTASEIEAFKKRVLEEELIILTLAETDYNDPIRVTGYYLNQTESKSQSGPQPDTEPASELTSNRLLQASPGQSAAGQLLGNEYYENKKFKWTIGELADRQLNLKIEWEQASQVSVSKLDTIFVSFKDPHKFLIGKDGVSAPDDLELPMQAIEVPKQRNNTQIAETLDVASGAVSSFLQVTSLVNIALASVAQQSLAPLWGQINALQLTVHIPLVNLVFPDVVQSLFEQLITFVTFDVVESLQEMGLLELNYDVSPTTAYNDSFERLGYDSSEPVGLLGTVNLIIGFLSIQVLWFFVSRIQCLKSCDKRHPEQVAASVIRFNIEMAFELFITVGAVFYPRDGLTLLSTENRTRFDIFGIIYTAALAFASVTFLILTTSRTLRQSRRIVRTNVRIRALKGKQIHELSLVAEEQGQDKKEAVQVSLLPSDDEDFQSFFEKQTAKGPHAREIRQLRLKRRKQRQEIRLYHEFYEGLNMTSEWAQLYHFFYIVRRLLLTLIALQLQNFVSMQLLSMVGLCMISQIFLLQARIFEDPGLYKMDIFNDYFVYLAVLHTLVLLVVETDIQKQDLIGFSLVSSVLLGLAFNIGSIARSILLGAQNSCKRAYIRMTGKARHWDATTKGLKGQGCPCKCYHCGAGRSTLGSRDAIEESPFELKLVSCKLANIQRWRVEPEVIMGEMNADYEQQEVVRGPRRAKITLLEEYDVSFSESGSNRVENQDRTVNASACSNNKLIGHQEHHGLSSTQIEIHAQPLDLAGSEGSSNSEDNEEVSQLRQQRNKTKQARAREWIETYGEDNFDQGRLVQRAKRLRIAEDPDQIDMDFFPDEEFLAIKQRQPHVVNNKRRRAVASPMVSHLQMIEEQPGEESKRGDTVRSQIGQEISSAHFGQYALWHQDYHKTQPRVRSSIEVESNELVESTKGASQLDKSAIRRFSGMNFGLMGSRPRKVSFPDQSELVKLDQSFAPTTPPQDPSAILAHALASIDDLVFKASSESDSGSGSDRGSGRSDGEK